MLVQDFWRPWNRLVTSSDASLAGFGVCQAYWPAEEVADCGRRPERARFRRVGPHSARESALESAGFKQDSAGRWFSSEGHASLQEAGWVIDDSFVEVPSAGLRRHLWSPKMQGRWAYKEDILVLEARAVLKGVKRVLLTRYGHDIRQLALCDNLSVVLAFGRGRSRNFKILKVLREFGAFLFARNVHVSIRWIPSELNIADEGSREFDDCKDSHLLVDHLVDAWADEAWPPSLHGLRVERADAGKEVKDAQLPSERQSSFVGCGKQSKTDLGPGQRLPSHRAPHGKEAEQSSCSEPFADSKIDRERGGAFGSAFGGGGVEEDSTDSQRPRGSGSKRERQHFIRSRGRALRRQRAHAEKQAKKTAQEDRRCKDEEQGHFSGGGCSVAQGSGQLSEAVARATRVCQKQWAPFSNGRGGGLSTGDLFQHALPFWGWQFGGGLHPGGAYGQAPTVWAPGLEEDSSGVEEPARVAQVVPISLEACLSSCGLDCYQLAHGCSGTCGEGVVQPPPGLDLPSSRYASQASSYGTGAANQRRHWTLVGGYKPYGDLGCIEDGDEGRLCDVGLFVAPVCQPTAGGIDEGPKTRQCVELRLRRVPLCLSQLLPGSEDIPCPVSGQTLGPQHRPGAEPENTGGGAEARRLAEPKECCSLREGRQAGCDVAKAGLGRSVDVSGSRAILARNYARPKLSGHTSSWPLSRGRYFADFFSGSGRVSRAVGSLGFKYRSWKACHADSHDLTDARVLLKVRADIKLSRILSAMLAPPSTSFLPAAGLRNPQFPWGLPDLQSSDEEKVRINNSYISSALQIISWMDAQHLPWIFEHPHSSLLWCIPDFIALQCASHTHVIVTDSCQWGTPFCRRIRLLAGNLSEDDVERCDRQCSGCGGFCSRSNLRHVSLPGKRRNSLDASWAWRYPHRLCHALARSLMAPHMLVFHDQL